MMALHSSASSGRHDCKKALCAASKYMVAVACIVALVTGILYAFLGKAEVPVENYEVGGGRLPSLSVKCVIVHWCVGETRSRGTLHQFFAECRSWHLQVRCGFRVRNCTSPSDEP